jgi:hypothetical protein
MLLISCSTEFKPASFETISIDPIFEADISVTYDKAKGRSNLSENINSNVEKAVVSTMSSSGSTPTINAILKDFNSEFVNFKKDYPEASEPVWELHIETEIIYQSTDVITIAINTYEFKGGAHGNDKIKFLNLNAKTGVIFNKNEIIKDTSDFRNLAKTYFEDALDIEEDHLTLKDFFFGKPFQLPENIGFSDDGLILLYNVYEIASYDQGYTEFIIPFDAAESYLKVH